MKFLAYPQPDEIRRGITVAGQRGNFTRLPSLKNDVIRLISKADLKATPRKLNIFHTMIYYNSTGLSKSQIYSVCFEFLYEKEAHEFPGWNKQ